MTKKKDPKDLIVAGRPTIMTPETIYKLEQAFSMGCSDLEACLHANIGKTTLYNYQQENPEFVERKEQLKEKLVLKARSVIAESLNNKDENTAKWYLERKCKNEFSTKEIKEVTGANGEPLNFTIEIVDAKPTND